MGQATITGGGTDGLYNVRIEKNLTAALAEKTAVAARIAALGTAIAAKTASVGTAQSALYARQADLDLAISRYIAKMAAGEDAEAARQAVVKAQTDAAAAAAALASCKRALNRDTLERESLQKRLDLLTAVCLAENRAGVWCADLSESLSGLVGTIEVNGEDGEILIMPAGAAGLGKLQPAGGGTPAGTFYNLAVLPCWQKFKPTYRVGTLTAVDKTANTCSVALAAAVSSVQDLGINQAETLAGVPVSYMT